MTGRPFSPGELAMLSSHIYDSDGDMALLLSRTRQQIRAQREAMGLLHGAALDAARRKAEAEAETETTEAWQREVHHGSS
jgi:hypothetical protein